ncbi:MAG: tripartite tricarboxylate transporter TctB family protein [Bacillota bacterium]
MLGAGVLVSSFGLGVGSPASPGPGAFPATVGLLMLVTALIGVVGACKDGRTVAASEGELRRTTREIIGAIAPLVSWYPLLPVTGYVLATFFVVLAEAKVFGAKGWVRSFAVALASAGLLYVLFDLLFYIDLPRGPLG